MNRTLFKQDFGEMDAWTDMFLSLRNRVGNFKMLQLLQGVATWGTPQEKQLFTCP